MNQAVKAKGGTVLVVEDDVALRFAIAGALRSCGFEAIEAGSVEAASRALSRAPQAVVTDLRLPDGDALELLPRVREADASTPVFIVTGYGTIDLAVRAVKQGAEDFLTKPVDLSALGTIIRASLDRRRRPRSGHPRPEARELVLRSDAMKRVEAEVERLRDADCSVLLLGETGTGKSLLAKRIHAVGARSRAPFVDINCAGLSKDLVEAELFGHERGAFTGALAAKQGLFEVANGGTLFLDEIGDIDLQVQPKLLKVLEEKRFRRLGDIHERTVEVRLVAATHHDLLRAAGAGQFRADLFYRISTVTIRVPPLRERREDILPLAHHILGSLHAPEVELSIDAKALLLDYAWPGNIRELKNVLERAVLLKPGDHIEAADLRPDAAPASSEALTLSEVEQHHIQSALDAEGGRVEAAARRLGVARSTLYRRLKFFGIR